MFVSISVDFSGFFLYWYHQYYGTLWFRYEINWRLVLFSQLFSRNCSDFFSTNCWGKVASKHMLMLVNIIADNFFLLSHTCTCISLIVIKHDRHSDQAQYCWLGHLKFLFLMDGLKIEGGQVHLRNSAGYGLSYFLIDLEIHMPCFSDFQYYFKDRAHELKYFHNL